jgi:c-di-GMP-binding flagellar brake protein YcgR
MIRMDNRRFDYRHAFPPGQLPPVELTLADGVTLTARAEDLSVGGATLVLDAQAARLATDQVLRVRFALPDAPRPFEFDAVVLHDRSDEGIQRYGLKFVALSDESAHEANEKSLWLHLLNEQRRRLAPSDDSSSSS